MLLLVNIAHPLTPPPPPSTTLHYHHHPPLTTTTPFNYHNGDNKQMAFIQNIACKSARS